MSVLDLKQLHTFLTVARTGSFSAAAERLHTTQPAVSARIRELENSLGAKLFDRTTRACHLTAKGRGLIGKAERLIMLAAEVQTDTAQTESISGLIRIGIPEPIALTWLPVLLHELGRIAPRLMIEVEVGLSTDLLPKLHTRALDLACIAGPATLPGIVCSKVGVLELAWLASSRMDIAEVPLTPQAFANRTYLLHVGSRHASAIETWFRQAGCQPLRTVSCNSIPALIKMASAGLGLTVLPISAVTDEIAAGLIHVVPSAGVLPANPYVVAHAERPLEFAVQTVIDVTRQVAARHIPEAAASATAGL